LKSYDARENYKNEQFLQKVFKMPPSVLPINNLGELSFILQQDRGAFTALDMSLKLFKQLDAQNLLKFKTLTLLASLLHRNGDTQSCEKIHESVFKAL
jgi:hypothetical protein